MPTEEMTVEINGYDFDYRIPHRIKNDRFKEIKDFGNGIVRPSVVETHSPLHEGYRSIMIYGEMTLREFPDEVFTLNYLPKLEELR